MSRPPVFAQPQQQVRYNAYQGNQQQPNLAQRPFQQQTSYGQQAHGPSPRALLREKWARTFGSTPHYLDGGLSNRLVLSLRSCLPAEIDWSLDRLIQVSGVDPDLLRFVELPGLLDGLLGLVRDWLDLVKTKSASDCWGQQELEDARRRATEATLVLRNLATEIPNLDPMKKSKKLVRTIADALEQGDDEMTELKLYLLEVLEVISETIPLVLPGRPLPPPPPTPTNNPSSEAPPPPPEEDHHLPPEPNSSPYVRLFPILVSLTRSPDRALVLASYRTLTALSQNPNSDPVLSLVVYTNPALSQFSTLLPPSSVEVQLPPHPVETAVSLLPLSDRELSLVVLDFIYQHTLLPSNAIAFCLRADLVHILRIIVSKVHLGARMENVDLKVPVRGGEGEIWYKRVTPAPALPRVKLNEPTELTTKMSTPELRHLMALSEPTRALTWMRLAYEAYADGEVTQVALWTAYRSEFEQYSRQIQMLPAADVVKMSTDAFPSALPMVTDLPDRRFIIRGIRIRDRTDMRQVFKCHWQGCTSPGVSTSAEALYWHLHHFHLSPAFPAPYQLPATRCQWATCRHVPGSTFAPVPASLTPAEITTSLSLHVRTHIQIYHPPPGYGGTPPKPLPPAPTDPLTAPVENPDWVESGTTYSRYHAEVDEIGEPTGLGLLGCLVLRNIARTVKIALGTASPSQEGGASGGVTTFGGGEAVGGGGVGAKSVAALSGGSESIFEAFERASEGKAGGAGRERGGRAEELKKVVEKVDFAPARKGLDALRTVEMSLVRTCMEDHILARILGEVVGVLSGAGNANGAGAQGGKKQP